MLRKAVLLLDPLRITAQLEFVRDPSRAQILLESGDHLWVKIDEDVIDRLQAQGITVQVHEEADLIELPSVIFSVDDGEPQLPSTLAAAAPTASDTTYYIVKFIAPPPEGWLEEIEQLGDMVEDIPFFGAAFRLTATNAAAVRELPFVAFVGLYHPAYALHYALAGRDEPFTAADLRELTVDESRVIEQPTGGLHVVPFLDITTESLAPLITAAGATLVADTGDSLLINAPAARVPDLLRVPGVRLIQAEVPAEPDNHRAGLISGVNQVRNLGTVDFLVNLDGTGEIVGVIDSGLDTGVIGTLQADFAGRVIQLASLNPPTAATDTDSHGTHTTGTVVASGVSAPPPTAANPNNTVPRGVAPGARAVFHAAISGPVPVGGGGPPWNVANFLNGFNTAYASGARVQTNSWGQNNNSNYDANSRRIDRFAFLRPDCTILFTTGNQEQDANGNGVLDMSRLRPQCTPKNVLAVGATESVTNLDGVGLNYRTAFPGRFTNAAFNPTAAVAAAFSFSDNANEVALFSARGRVNGGPAALRRIKPDLVAPGTNIVSTGPVALLPFAGNRLPATAPGAFYFVTSGSSMACPHVAGACLLVRQFYRTRFAELRRPVLVSALPAFVDRPFAILHSAGALVAWIDNSGGPNDIFAARFSRGLVQVGNIERIVIDAGIAPAFSLARHGNNTLVLRRATDSTLRLQLFSEALAAVVAFGTGGTVTPAPASRGEPERRPTLAVRQDEVAVLWFETGNDNLRFQRFNALNGAPIDAASRILGTGTGSSPHPFLIFQDNRWAAVWILLTGGNHQLMFRLIDAAGAFQGAQPSVLLTQAQALREPAIVWDSVASRYVVVYVTESGHAGGDIHAMRLRADGTADGASVAVITVPAAQAVRGPSLAVHPDGNAYILTWEDNTQGTFDVHLAVFDFSAAPVRIRRQAFLSDTPQPTSGFGGLVDGEGILAVWHSNDEINSDLLGIYALRLTPDGVFQAQADPRTPLLQSGHYVAHRLTDHDNVDLIHNSMVWGGGDFYILHADSDPGAVSRLIRTNPDGLLDTRMAPQSIGFGFGFHAICLHWTGNQLVACDTDPTFTSIHLLNLDGTRVATFGSAGTLLLAEFGVAGISVQAAHRMAAGALNVFVAWGRRDNDAGPTRIRFTSLRANGTAIVAARDLVVGVAGTARHGWFHALETESPFRLIACWHIQSGANTGIRLNRFQADGTPQPGQAAPIDINAPVGDSMNAVIAPRPILFEPPFPTPAGSVANTRRREFGIAFQFRPAAAAPWQILFTRLNRNGTVQATLNIGIFNDPANHGLDPQLVWHTDGYGVAFLQQPLAGGPKRLFFGIRDQNGARVQLNQPPVPPPGAAPPPVVVLDFPLSSATADVQHFQLVWNGRTFRLCWTETEAGRLRLMQRSVTVPRLAGFDRNNNPRNPTLDEPFQEPSSALVRATLINGATNLNNTALPNIPQTVLAAHNPVEGYGWGRLNLRQSLAPAPPVTFHIRDDASVAQGRTARYEFSVPTGTLLIRVTLCWADPPGRSLVNNLNLRVTTPPFAVGGVRTFVGNRWQAAAAALVNPQPSSPLPTPAPANPFEGVHTIEQVVIVAPPALPAGVYIVEVIGQSIPGGAFQQFPGQPFSLVFVGSGNELRTALPLPAGPLPIY